MKNKVSAHVLSFTSWIDLSEAYTNGIRNLTQSYTFTPFRKDCTAILCCVISRMLGWQESYPSLCLVIHPIGWFIDTVHKAKYHLTPRQFGHGYFPLSLKTYHCPTDWQADRWLSLYRLVLKGLICALTNPWGWLWVWIIFYNVLTTPVVIMLYIAIFAYLRPWNSNRWSVKFGKGSERHLFIPFSTLLSVRYK